MLQLHHMSAEQWYPWEEMQVVSGRRGKPWLWIGLPLIVGTLIVAGTVAAVFLTGFGALGVWADVSLVVILLPLCILGFIPLVMLVALSYGIGRLVDWLPAPLRQVEAYLARASRETGRGSEFLARPLVLLHGYMAMFTALLRGLINLLL